MSYSNVIRGAAALIGVLVATQSMAATPDEPVCRYLPRPGSHMWMHVCVTQAEWVAMQEREAAFQGAASAAGQFGTGNGTAVSTVSVNLNR